jgi:2-polyprenyl-3-methyl-5-hydroxy-6-metoxy-1,4-benzoquinol methylase
MNKWKQIWENRDTSFAKNKNEDVLIKLIQADGFDGGGGNSCITANSWRAYVSLIETELLVRKADSIFEVGCGCGAILYPLHKAGHKVGGLDYSETLVKKAQEILPDASLVTCEASLIDILPKYDFVIANSMFFYFPDFSYATLVLDKMYEKAKKGIAILDVPDARSESILERKKRDACSNYDEKYEGLKHLYYNKGWFLDFAEQKQCSKITISKQNIKGYGYNDFRFNCFMIK